MEEMLRKLIREEIAKVYQGGDMDSEMEYDMLEDCDEDEMEMGEPSLEIEIIPMKSVKPEEDEYDEYEEM